MIITQSNESRRGNPLRMMVWGIAVFLLLLPLIAMQFTSEVNWKFGDFVVFSLMLLAVCGGYEFAARLTNRKAYRLAAGIVLIGVFLLTWIILAIDI